MNSRPMNTLGEVNSKETEDMKEILTMVIDE